MALVTLALGLVFVLFAFGVRSFIHYKRTGSLGCRGFTGRIGSLEWFGGALFAIAMVLALVAPLLRLGDPTTIEWVRVLPLVLGIVGTLHAQIAMGASWRVGVSASERTELVRRGPFRWVRNPIFTWMIVAVAGVALTVPSWVSVAALVALVVAIEIQVRAVEEPYLLRTHGREYAEYAATTGRFVPFVGKLS